jgi:hypothetical protein
MKKYILICSMVLALGSTLKAQMFDDDAREKVTVGVKAGANISNIWDSESQDFQASAKAGFAGGAFLGIPLGKFLGVQPEILLSQKGFQATGSLLGSEYSFKRTTTYIDVPLQLQFKPSRFVTLLVGPQYSYLIHQKDMFQAGPAVIVQEQEIKNDKIRKNIFGGVAGLDVNLSHVVISGRAGLDMLNNNGDGTSTTPRYKNRWVQISLGFKI